MTSEEIEMLSGAVEVIEGLKDHLRNTQRARPASDGAAASALSDLLTALHAVISDVSRHPHHPHLTEH